MKKLKIINKQNYEYYLQDEKGREYNINLEFLDLDLILNIGDYIVLSNELLNPTYGGYSTSYTFGNLKNKFGKENITMNDIDVIKVVSDKTEIFLKRLYG